MILAIVFVVAKDLGIDQIRGVGIEDNPQDLIAANRLDQGFYIFSP